MNVRDKNSRLRNRRLSNVRQRRQQHLLDVKVRSRRATQHRVRSALGAVSKIILIAAVLAATGPAGACPDRGLAGNKAPSQSCPRQTGPVTAIPLPTLSGDERPVPSMPQPSPPDRPDAAEEVILGIDTHKDVHAAVVISLLGVVLGRRCFSTTASGYESLLDWARGFGALRRAGVECTGSYGKALTRYLRAATGDIAVIEVNKPDRATPCVPRNSARLEIMAG